MHSGRPYHLEACVTSLAQALEAQQKGADRVELCVRLETEGMTPDPSLVSSLCDQLQIPVRVMVRVTENGYEADVDALNEMIISIDALKKLPLDGFVFGVLKENRIDREAMLTLLRHAHPFPVTFHKAIDISENIHEDLEWLNQLPQVDTILSSGGAVKAIDGMDVILEMKSLFRGQIMAAGKVTPEVLPALHDRLQLKWYHGRAIL
jgi:copper homeostasis protein